jgi:hypothetical protein
MPAVATKGSAVLTGHLCSTTTTIKTCSTSVFAGGVGVSRLGDFLSPHTILVGEYCVPHPAAVGGGSSTVFVNGRPIARVGDSADFGKIISGVGSVIAG